MKNNGWHMITVDFHCGDNENGTTIRKKLIAMKRSGRLEIFWQGTDNG